MIDVHAILGKMLSDNDAFLQSYAVCKISALFRIHRLMTIENYAAPTEVTIMTATNRRL